MTSPRPIEDAGTARANEDSHYIVPPLSDFLARFDVVHPSRPWDEDLEPQTDDTDSDLDDFFPVDFSSHSPLSEHPPPVFLAPFVPSSSAESVTSFWLSPPTSPDTTTGDDPAHNEGSDDTDYSDLPDLVPLPEFSPLFLSPPNTPRGNDLTPKPTPAPTFTGPNSPLVARSKQGYFDICTKDISSDDIDAGCRCSWNTALGSPQRCSFSLPSPIAATACSGDHICGSGEIDNTSRSGRRLVLRRKPARVNLRADYLRDACRRGRLN